MRVLLVLGCLVAGMVLHTAAGLAQDAPSYVSPYVPVNSGQLAEKARQAAIRVLEANCALTEAHRQVVSSELDAANRLIAEAMKEYQTAAQAFMGVAKSVSARILINAPARTEVIASYQTLERYHLARPRTYTEAFSLLHGVLANRTKFLSDLRFHGDIGDIERLRMMMRLQGEIAEVFLAVTTLTVYGHSAA